MIRASLKIICLLLILIVGAAALWWFRPGSEYSPAETFRAVSLEDRTESFRNMEATYPYREIVGAEIVRDFARGSRLEAPSYMWRGNSRTLNDYAQDWKITGLMVVRDSEIVFEDYWRGETAESRHTSWSVAKSVVATLIGHALMTGQIESLDDTVETYAPEYAEADYGKVQLKHLLMMSAGMDFEEEYERRDGDARRLFIDTMIFNRDIDASIAKTERNRLPGEDHDYISPNSAVLAAVVRGAYGDRPLTEIVGEVLFERLGLAEGTWLLDRQDGKALGYCCLQIRLEDYAKLGQLYLDDGIAPDGTRIFGPDWAEFVSTSPQASHRPADRVSEEREDGLGYGQHFWLPPAREGEYLMAGYNGQIVWIDPAHNVVIAMTSAEPDFANRGMEWIPMMRAFARAAAAKAP